VRFRSLSEITSARYHKLSSGQNSCAARAKQNTRGRHRQSYEPRRVDWIHHHRHLNPSNEASIDRSPVPSRPQTERVDARRAPTRRAPKHGPNGPCLKIGRRFESDSSSTFARASKTYLNLGALERGEVLLRVHDHTRGRFREPLRIRLGVVRKETNRRRRRRQSPVLPRSPRLLVGRASQGGKAKMEISRSRSLYQVYAQTVTRKQNAEKKRLFRRARGKRKSKRTGSTFCFLAFALPPPVCALAPLAPPAPDLPPPLVVVAAPDLPLAAAPLAASECAVNVSYTVGTSLILEKSASLCRREGKPDK